MPQKELSNAKIRQQLFEKGIDVNAVLRNIHAHVTQQEDETSEAPPTGSLSPHVTDFIKKPKSTKTQQGLFYDVPMDACNRKIAHLMSMMYSSSDSTTSKRAAKKAWPRPESRQTSKKKSKNQQRWDVEKILDIRWLDFDESYDEWVPQHFLSLPYDQYNCDPIVLDKMNSLEGC